MEITQDQLMEFLRRNVGEKKDVKADFVTYKNWDEKKGGHSSPAYYEFSYQFSKIFFYPNTNDMQEHKKYLEEEKRCELIVEEIQHWSGGSTRVVYNCILKDDEEAFFGITVIDGRIENRH